MIYAGRSFRQQQKFKQGPGWRPPRASQVHFWQCSGVCVCVCMYIYILRTTTVLRCVCVCVGTYIYYVLLLVPPLEPLKYTSDIAQVCVCVCLCVCTYMWTHCIFFYFKRKALQGFPLCNFPHVTPLNLGQTVKNWQLYPHFPQKNSKSCTWNKIIIKHHETI
jgi:hypothetical protein